MMKIHRPIAVLSLLLAAATAQAQIEVTIENLQPSDGFFFTPVWVGFHDGSFDVQTVGEPASNFPGLQALAEEGMTGGVSSHFASEMPGGLDSTITSPGGFAGAPVFDPGESVTTTFMVPDPATNRYFSYASMVIPSNDAFFANGDPMALELFDAAGNFNGPVTVTIVGTDIYDAGTEVNDEMGAAFSALGGMRSDENGLIAIHEGLDDFLGTDTAAGTTINSSLSNGGGLARITIQQVPEPTSAGMLLLGLAGLALRRRR